MPEIEKPASTEAPTIAVKGNTTEQVLRALLDNPTVDPYPTIAALVARFDARAAKRASKEEDAG